MKCQFCDAYYSAEHFIWLLSPPPSPFSVISSTCTLGEIWQFFHCVLVSAQPGVNIIKKAKSIAMCSCPGDSMNPEAGRAQQLAERSAGTCLGPIQMKAGCWGMSVHHPGLGCYVPQPLPKGLFRLPDWQAWELRGSVPTRDSGSTQSDVVHRLPVPLGTPAPTTA